MVREIKGTISGAGRRVAIAVARFNELVSERLLQGATDALQRHGTAADDITVVRVPGSFELPLTCRWLADSGRHDAVLALGAVIRGATPHFDYVCGQAARGTLDAAVASSIPVIFGVLTCDTMDQALDRAGGKAGNKGAEAAVAALEMVALKGALGEA
ncbi:MAG: 6,7-dimethyl-8-ribityllumazine synthase [Planctomycetota bacterium]